MKVQSNTNNQQNLTNDQTNKNNQSSANKSSQFNNHAQRAKNKSASLGNAQQQKPGNAQQQKPGNAQQQRPGNAQQQRPGNAQQQKPGNVQQQKQPGNVQQQKPSDNKQNSGINNAQNNALSPTSGNNNSKFDVDNAISRLNEARASASNGNAKPLTQDPRLQKIAEESAANALERFIESPFLGHDTDFLDKHDVAENLSGIFRPGSEGNPNSALDTSIKNWLNSETHKELLTDPSYQKTGLAYASKTVNGTTYEVLVQIFDDK